MIAFSSLLIGALAFERYGTCPGSGATAHTMAQMTVNFQEDCATVADEITARGKGEEGWKDPHNRGQYTVLASGSSMVMLKRRTGNNRYTDKITFSLSANGGGCKAVACSESQGNSNNDQGANMCNMSNLFCNSSLKSNNGVACRPINADLNYQIQELECGRFRGNGQYRGHQCQNMANTCLVQASEAMEMPLEEGEPDFNGPLQRILNAASN